MRCGCRAMTVNENLKESKLMASVEKLSEEDVVF